MCVCVWWGEKWIETVGSHPRTHTGKVKGRLPFPDSTRPNVTPSADRDGRKGRLKESARERTRERESERERETERARESERERARERERERDRSEERRVGKECSSRWSQYN